MRRTADPGLPEGPCADRPIFGKMEDAEGRCDPPGARLSVDNGAREPMDRFGAPIAFPALPNESEE